METGLYKHYKGNTYEVIALSLHTETLEEMVVYRSQDGKVWVRPKAMFFETVIVDSKEMPRFVQIN